MRIVRIIRLVLVFILERNHNQKNYRRTTNVCPSLFRRIHDPNAYGFGMRSWSFSSSYVEELWVEIGPDESWITFCSYVIKARFSPSHHHYYVKLADCFASRRYSLKNKLVDRMIKQLLIVICQCLADQGILLNLNRPIIVKYPSQCVLNDTPRKADQYSAIIRESKHKGTIESVERQL